MMKTVRTISKLLFNLFGCIKSNTTKKKMAENNAPNLVADVTASYKRKIRFKAGTDLSEKVSVKTVNVDVVDASEGEVEHLIVKVTVESNELAEASDE